MKSIQLLSLRQTWEWRSQIKNFISTLSLNFVAQQICLGNCQFSIGKRSPEPNMASSDTDDDI